MNDGTNPKQQKRSAVQSDHRTESVKAGFESSVMCAKDKAAPLENERLPVKGDSELKEEKREGAAIRPTQLGIGTGPQNLLVRLRSLRWDTMAAITESVLRT